MAYATLEDLQAYLGDEPPAGAQKLLADASRLIDGVLVSTIYAVDSVTGLPTDAAVTAGLNLATCQQAAWWISNDADADSEDPTKWTSFQIEGISVARADSSQLSRRSRLCDAAFDTLRLTVTGTVAVRPLLPGKPTASTGGSSF